MTSLAKPNQAQWWRRTVVLFMVLTLPLVGVALLGLPLAPYLSFPPRTEPMTHAPFSFGWSLVYALIDLILMGAILAALKAGRNRAARVRTVQHQRQPVTPWPWWGWAGLLVTLTGWILTWNRFAWFAAFQRHAFIFPWMGYLLTVNAITKRRTGSCLLTRSPQRLFLLAGTSCLFWWMFEYLNRFVQSWYYVAVGLFGPTTYSLLASLAFCTILPVVMSTYELLLSTALFNHGLARLPLKITAVPKRFAWGGLALGSFGLAAIGVWPDQLFALMWVAPLILLTAVDHLCDHSPLLKPLEKGDYRQLVGPAAAALICGFFWELWNVGSLAKWRYTLPYVQWDHIFEMPLLGYGGYLPFGVLCWLISRPLLSDISPAGGAQEPPAESHPCFPAG
jgi:hypothetical protein